MWAFYHGGKKTKSYVTLSHVTLCLGKLHEFIVKIQILKYAELEDGETA